MTEVNNQEDTSKGSYKSTDFESENFTNRIKLSHSDLSVDMNYDEKIDAYNPIEFHNYLSGNGGLELKASLPKNKKNRCLPDIQILSKFFLFCKDNFKGISAMIVFDDLTDFLEISPKDMLDNVSRPIRGQLIKELKTRISLDKYNKRVKQEFVSRNGAIQPSLSSNNHTQNY